LFRTATYPIPLVVKPAFGDSASVRARLLLLFAFSLAVGAAVATAQNGHNEKRASKPSQTVTMPTLPTTQPSPPPVKTQTTPTTPTALGDLPRINDRLDRRELNTIIALRPELAPWKEQIWYAAHYSYSNVSASGLAGLMWCIVYRIPACSRDQDAQATHRKTP
jgi:hypothetical protein